MIHTPRLINNCRTISLPNTLFSDFQLDKILSAAYYSAAIWAGIAAVILLPLWLLKPWKYFKRSWIGIIDEITYEDRRESVSKNPADTRHTNQRTVTYILCRVNTEKNKRAAFMLDARYDSVYHVGDAVMCISGLDYPINLSKEKLTVCPKCGKIMPQESERCVACELPTVIK